MELKSTSPPSLLPEEAIPDAASPPGRSGRSLGMIWKLGEDCLNDFKVIAELLLQLSHL